MHQMINRMRAAAALPKVIGGPRSDDVTASLLTASGAAPD